MQAPQNKIINEATKTLIDKLLLEKIPLAFQSLGYKAMSLRNIRMCHLRLRCGLKKGRLTIQGDEMWSFVGDKDNKQWIWLALDIKTREIVGVYIGDRSRDGAQGLWDALPPVYRQCAVSYTDYWSACAARCSPVCGIKVLARGLVKLA